MATVAETLEMAADKLEPEGAWTQFSNARDASGGYTPPTWPDAICWCASGVIRAASGTNLSARYAAHDLLGSVIGEKSITNWNDAPERTQAEVVAALRAAAAKAREL